MIRTNNVILSPKKAKKKKYYNFITKTIMVGTSSYLC